MICDESFGAGMTVLEARFGPVCRSELGSQSDRIVKEFYRQALDDALDDDQFEQGVKAVIAANRFFPTPQEIIDAAIGTPKELGLAEWTRIVTYRTQPGKPLSLPVSAAGRYAADSVGGIRFLVDQISEGSLSSVRRDFIESYVLAVKRGLNWQVQQVPLIEPGEPDHEESLIDPEGIRRLAKMVADLQKNLSMTEEAA